jgi:hypothetical protein
MTVDGIWIGNYTCSSQLQETIAVHRSAQSTVHYSKHEAFSSALFSPIVVSNVLKHRVHVIPSGRLSLCSVTCSLN